VKILKSETLFIRTRPLSASALVPFAVTDNRRRERFQKKKTGGARIARRSAGSAVRGKVMLLRGTELSAFDESEIVQKLKARDAGAFEQLIAKYQTQIFNLLYRMTGVREEAEDLAQEVFVNVYRKIGLFREESPLGTWIFRIAYNACKNRRKYLHRRRDRDRQPFDETVERHVIESGTMSTSSRVSRPDELAEGFEMERLVQAAISALEEEQRVILVLRDIQSFAYEDISEITGLPIGTVKSRLHRARMALKERLAPYLR
jgi:RNA polymerase sigma-70 factor, ECF subfamily